ncbi:MAG: penicillin-binding protein 1C [Chitinispirillia bacterium]|nr:penicillin-binding protein 1C [Chitinispirillia bacterium]MCL2267698.1 penicillin-binding protein 1C [Chitinispirillia bacterium]
MIFNFRPGRRTIIIICCTALTLLTAFWFCLPSPLFQTTYSTTVYDRDGLLLGARVSQNGEWRFPPQKELPERYITSLIAYEDRYFYYHPGVNPGAIFRAFWQNIRAKKTVSGGSTITMQTIRMARGRKRNVYQKCIEMIMATRLELTQNKSEILSLYAAHAPFGSNVMGIDAASWRYFGHSSADLSWAEAALLAVLPNAPSAMHVKKNRPALLQKRNRLITRLYESGKMDEITWRLALDEPLPDEPFPLPQLAPHLVSSLQIERPGQMHITTIDAALQFNTERVLKRWNAEFSQNKIQNLAAVVFDVEKGEVTAYCGNVNFGTRQAGSQVDIIQAPRSSGSILKPFLYQLMLQEGELLPQMLIPDIPIMAEGFQPQNYNLKYNGAVPASLALSRSLNLPSVNMLRQYGVPKFLADLRETGFSTFKFPADHYGLTLILGGGEVTLWETSLAYLRMAQSVVFNTREQQRSNRLDWGQVPLFSQREAGNFSAGAGWQTLEALIHVNRPEDIDWKSIPSVRKVAWKTGTSYGFRDAWAVGVTPEYVVGVWTGNASGEGRTGLTGTGTSAVVMFDIFNLLGNTSWFEMPASAFEEAEICKASGHLAGRHCGEIEKRPILPAGFRTPACTYHSVVHLSEDENYRVYANCYPADKMIRKTWFILPPIQEWFYKKRHPNYRALPPLSPSCAGNQATVRAMEFIYPNTPNAVRLSKQLDGSTGALALELAHRQPNAIVYWHLNNDYLGSTQYFHQMSITPNEGRHLITVVDEWGNTLSRWLEVR